MVLQIGPSPLKTVEKCKRMPANLLKKEEINNLGDLRWRLSVTSVQCQDVVRAVFLLV